MLGELISGVTGLLGSKKEGENPFSSLLGTLGSGMASGITSGFTDNLFGKDPAKEALKMADTLYPGTTPYERLTSGGGGAAGAGSAESVSQKGLQAQINQAKRQADLKAQEIKNQKSIADNNNTTAKEVATIAANAKKDTSPVDETIEGATTIGDFVAETHKQHRSWRTMKSQEKRYYSALVKAYGYQKANAIWDKEHATGKFIPGGKGVTGVK